MSLTTDRLILRQWGDDDLEPFAALNADPEVMEFFPRTLTREESDTTVERFQGGIADRDFGFWAVEVQGGAPFIGFVGVSPTRHDLHFTPAHEVGWRLARPHWGHGYATEAGAAALEFGFDELGMDEIVAYTGAANSRSRRVMDRLGMSYEGADDFDHPEFPEGHPHRRNVLYGRKRHR